jgi:hypothetical protein
MQNLPPINSKDSAESSAALFECLKHNDLAGFKLLESKGYQPNLAHSFVYGAIRHGNVEFLAHLLRYPFPLQDKGYAEAINEFGNPDMLRLLAAKLHSD